MQRKTNVCFVQILKFTSNGANALSSKCYIVTRTVVVWLHSEIALICSTDIRVMEEVVIIAELYKMLVEIQFLFVGTVVLFACAGCFMHKRSRGRTSTKHM